MISTTPQEERPLLGRSAVRLANTRNMCGRFELWLRTDIQNEDETSCSATMCTEKIASTLFPRHISNSYKTVRNVLSVCFTRRPSLVVQYKQRDVRVYHYQEMCAVRIILYIEKTFQWSLFCLGRNSSVGIATCFGLDGPGIEFRWERDFPHPYRPALGPTQPPIQWVKRPGRGVDHPPLSSSEVEGIVEL